MRCSSCGNILDPDDIFCGDCGQPVNKQAPKPEAPPPPPPPAPVRQQPTPPPQVQRSAPPPPQFSSQQAPPRPMRSYTPPPPKKKKSISGCLIAVVVVVVIGGCIGFGILGFGLISIPDIFNPGSGGGLSGQGTVYIDNMSSETICEVYISLSSSGDWGNDWLGSNAIGAGTSTSFKHSFYGETVDIALVDCSGYLMYEEDNFYVSEYDFTVTYYGQ